MGYVAAASACGAGRRLCVRDAKGAPKGRSRRAERGETEPREPRSSPTPRRGGLLARPARGHAQRMNFEGRPGITFSARGAR